MPQHATHSSSSRSSHQAPAVARRGYSTAEFGAMLGVLPESIRTAVWRHGHYAGIKPIKPAGGRNTRLVWPVAAVDALFGEVAA